MSFKDVAMVVGKNHNWLIGQDERDASFSVYWACDRALHRGPFGTELAARLAVLIIEQCLVVDVRRVEFEVEQTKLGALRYNLDRAEEVWRRLSRDRDQSSQTEREWCQLEAFLNEQVKK